MQRSPSVELLTPESGPAEAGPLRLPWAPAFPLRPLARFSLWLSVVVVAALWAWGAWQRRWIADDGLIVLRTVRNLLAGNGPVFNAGERVETNTSTLWTFLTYFGGLIGGPVRLEYVALTLALCLSVAGVVLANARHRKTVRPKSAGTPGVAAAGRCAGLHRDPAGT